MHTCIKGPIEFMHIYKTSDWMYAHVHKVSQIQQPLAQAQARAREPSPGWLHAPMHTFNWTFMHICIFCTVDSGYF
jgi:hypothetical protein